MKGLLSALSFLTRLPLPRVAADDATFAASMRWFPAVGLLLGGLVAIGGWCGAWLGAWTGALAALAIWIAVTGALHLDGLADISDAGGATHKNRDSLLAVLADPHIGSFGTVALVMQLLAKLVLLHGMIEARLWPTLLLIPFAARIGPLVWTLWLPPLHDGLAARFREPMKVRHVAFWGIVLTGCAALSPSLLATPLCIWLWGDHVRRRIGGLSGDGHGAGIELMETALLLAALVWARIA